MACPHFEYYGASSASQKLSNTETETGERKSKKEGSEIQSGFITRDYVTHFPGWKHLKVRNTMSVKEWKMNSEQVIAGFVKSNLINTQWNQI